MLRPDSFFAIAASKQFFFCRASNDADPWVALEVLFHGAQVALVETATFVGALPYMAPELIQDPKTAGLSADVWSLGAILYELMSGEQPFGSGLRAVTRIVKGELPSKPSLHGSSPQFTSHMDDLWQIVEASLQLDPSKRVDVGGLVKLCADLRYPIRDREYGEVDRYGHSTGAFGFIRAAGRDVFFHKDSYYGAQPAAGDQVAFACFDGGGAERAIPVVPLRK